MDIEPSPKAGDMVVKIGEVDFFFTPDAENILSDLTTDYSDGHFHSEKV